MALLHTAHYISWNFNERFGHSHEVEISKDVRFDFQRAAMRQLKQDQFTTELDTFRQRDVLVEKGIPIVIITLGRDGVLITTEKYQKKIPAFKVGSIIDTTGAGDTFNGAFSYAYWIKKWDLEKSCKYANAAAALKIQKLGARTGMPYERMLMNF